ncbi:MAG: oligosaccharide flippase family protein [Candidatus Desantisbacteria bacterium]
MSTAKRVTKNIFFKFSGEIVVRVLSLLFITYLIRTLSVSEYGRFNYALSFTTMFAFLIDLGVGVILMREVAKNKEAAPKYFGNILILKLISSIITYFLIIFSIHLLSHDKTTIFLTYIFGLWLIGQCLIEFQTAFFIAFEQLKFEAIVNTIT